VLIDSGFDSWYQKVEFGTVRTIPSLPLASTKPSPRTQRLLDTLEDLFLKEGFRRVSIAALAARLRCSRRTLYQLAPSKQDLFLLVLDRFLARIRRLGDDAAEGTANLALRIEAYLAPGVRETARASNVFFGDIADLPQAKRMLDDHQRRRIGGIRRIIVDGRRRGVFRGFDPHLVAEVFTHAYRRVSQPDFLADAKLSMTEAYGELSRLLLHGLLHPQPGPARKPRNHRRPDLLF
jgi:AcrR family transcriptional regulator